MSTEIDDVNQAGREIGQRLKEEVQRVGGPSKADDVIRSARATLYNWFASGLIPAIELEALSRIGVDVDYVVRGIRSTDLRIADRLGEYSPSALTVTLGGQQFPINPNDYRWIPFFDVEIAGGGGRTVDFQAQPTKFNAYRKDYLESMGILTADLFEAKVVNDSMIPEILPNEVIMVNASNKTIVSGEIYVVSMEDEWICKYLRRLPGDRIEVYSANAEVHKPFEIREGEIGNGIEIVGHVARQGRDRVRR
jgi:hypothetical protein